MIEKTLEEWDYKIGELYIGVCTDSAYSKDGILFFAIIEGKSKFKWNAFLIDEDDLNEFEDILEMLVYDVLFENEKTTFNGEKE